MALDAFGTSTKQHDVRGFNAINNDGIREVAVSGASRLWPSSTAPIPSTSFASGYYPGGIPNSQPPPLTNGATNGSTLKHSHGKTLSSSNVAGTPTRIPQSLPPPSSLPTVGTEDRPSKRRKIQNDASHKPASPSTKAKALSECLQHQVFPHLERAIRAIDKNLYDVEKLGGRIIGKVADKEFERHFNDGNGRLAPDVEATVVIRIHRLVTECIAGNEFRRCPPVPPAPVRTPSSQQSTLVLPSIEDTPDVMMIDENEQDNANDEMDEGDAEEYFNGDLDPSDEAGQQPISPPPQVHPKKKPKKPSTTTTSQQLRTRAKATQWQSGRSYELKRPDSPLQVKNQWFGQSSRPYLPAPKRHQIAAGIGSGRLVRLQSDDLALPSVYHVDFSIEEVRFLREIARYFYGKPILRTKRTDLQDIRHLMKKSPGLRARLLDVHRQKYDSLQQPPPFLLKRPVDALENFLDDLQRRQVETEGKSLYLQRDDNAGQHDVPRINRVSSLLLAREVVGNRLGATRQYQNFTTAFKTNREDQLEPRVEWTNCAGDIMTVSWLPDSTRFVCGTTTHSDSHNQQYNRPGNLLFGSAASNTLKAYPDHRIPRPVVTHGENALDSMRESQDPWLYTSVVSSDYDPFFNYVFTSSFDNTVKVWWSNNGTIELRETWHHEGRVNFVVTNKAEPISKIATAVDVPTKAVRVYSTKLHPEDKRLREVYSYSEYSCKRVHGEDYIPLDQDKWAYFPAAIRWGVEQSVKHLLLIGYSPRSLNHDDNEIPEDKRDTGELCLWDTNTDTEIKVNSAATSNVFEVAWHPSRPSFAAATSASQTSEKIDIRTQIRIFELNEAGQYAVVKTLDCPAIDINELVLRPNSTLYSYVAAGCTDGKVYIWDSARTDDEDPISVLEHGEPVEEIIGDREQEDVGVKFVAWATTTDRLYTGSSDGVVKVWNIRQGKGVLVKDLMEVAAPITVGAFSPDFTKLIIGDGSGRVYLMDVNEWEDNANQDSVAAISSGFVKLQLDGKQRAIRRPRPFIPHGEVPPPYQNLDSDAYHLGQERAKEYLETSQLALISDPTIGAVQGPAYTLTGLYRAEAHLDGNVAAPLISAFETQQRANQSFSRTSRYLIQGSTGGGTRALSNQHRRNIRLDRGLGNLTDATRAVLLAEKAELDVSPMDFDYDSD
ncbi:hypothetical protein M426DRAFT_320946 [Hypoxylon sp. CI-4A]|nr:hypothetical protein M426DRAFT_320946 [Hypoxylon sp. CI-4A]